MSQILESEVVAAAHGGEQQAAGVWAGREWMPLQSALPVPAPHQPHLPLLGAAALVEDLPLHLPMWDLPQCQPPSFSSTYHSAARAAGQHSYLTQPGHPTTLSADFVPLHMRGPGMLTPSTCHRLTISQLVPSPAPCTAE